MTEKLPPEPELTAEDMFGTDSPGTPVQPSSYGNHLAGYRPRGRWVRRSDNKWVRLPDDPREWPETQDNTRKE